MKREEKNALSRQRILDAAMEEFSRRGYEGASLNTVCAEKGLSKGIIYHYFSDKDDLYLLCVKTCFDDLTSYLRDTVRLLSGSVEERLQRYFDARLRFFTEHPLYLGIFTGAVCDPPPGLVPAIAERRRTFDDLNISVLTELLNSVVLDVTGRSVPPVDFWLFHFTDESPEQVARILARPAGPDGSDGETTAGLYRRGVQ